MKLELSLRGTRTVKALMLGAVSHAEALGDTAAGAEHLLLSALDLPDGLARRAFVAAGGDPDAVADAIAAAHVHALHGVGIESVPDDLLGPLPRRATGRQRFNESAVSVVRGASKRTTGGREDTLGPNVLIAVAGLQHATAARTLHAMELDPSALVESAQIVIREHTADRPD